MFIQGSITNLNVTGEIPLAAALAQILASFTASIEQRYIAHILQVLMELHYSMQFSYLL
jgi:hypothetical protein